MIDDQGCEGSGSHTFCCPSTQAKPMCGWWKHDNGHCEHGCPPGAIEIGGNNKYCNNGNYQSACCYAETLVPHQGEPATVELLPSIELYGQCGWGPSPNCPALPICGGAALVALSYSSNGGSHCDSGKNTYCCSVPTPSKRWDDCKWYDNLGAGVSGEGSCRSGCPADTVRVAMEHGGPTGCDRGARALCCVAGSTKLVPRTLPFDESDMRDVLERFLNDPTCVYTGSGNKKRAEAPLRKSTLPFPELRGTLETDLRQCCR